MNELEGGSIPTAASLQLQLAAAQRAGEPSAWNVSRTEHGVTTESTCSRSSSVGRVRSDRRLGHAADFIGPGAHVTRNDERQTSRCSGAITWLLDRRARAAIQRYKGLGEMTRSSSGNDDQSGSAPAIAGPHRGRGRRRRLFTTLMACSRAAARVHRENALYVSISSLGPVSTPDLAHACLDPGLPSS